MSLVAGTRLGPYEIQSAIGAGGMGQVYRSCDTRLDRTVAIKILPPKRWRRPSPFEWPLTLGLSGGPRAVRMGSPREEDVFLEAGPGGPECSQIN